MKKITAVGILFVSSFYLTIGNAKDRIIEGVISEYECGDNCYLTIIKSNGKEHTGLCTAALCQKWNENAEMPVKFKGQKVRITVGKEFQYDGSGNVAGEPMDSFDKIILNLENIYFAADTPPTDYIPKEAPLCYQFQVASLEEQLNKIRAKYSNLYDYKIVNNSNGSRSLLAKRKDDQGNEVNYFYSTSPRICNEYQQKRLGSRQ
ncbi:hypothetical protein HUU62_01525 [Rhodoferax sp. 4810]|nr:hypothetical protein [Rhodoferax jenense]